MTLLLAAHGTRDPAGARVVGEIADRVRDTLGVAVAIAYADVRQPSVTSALRAIAGPVVVVPAFLAAGYHVRVDVPLQVTLSGHPDVVITEPLGPAPRVVAAAHDRLVAAGWRRGDAIVLAAAGSSDADARADVRRAAAGLGARTGTPVRIGYVTTATPTVDEVVEHCRRENRRVVVASWLLAPGLFHRWVAGSGADLVADPLGAHPLVVDLVARRYREARPAPTPASPTLRHPSPTDQPPACGGGAAR